MFSKIANTLWGDLSKDEYKKFGLLSLTFLFIIGTYWLMRPLKDSLFGSIVGIEWQPRAKMLSFLCIIPLIMIYSKLVDWFDKQKLFYVVTIFYSAFFFLIALLLMSPALGLANTVASPKRILGWVIYVGIESFGSLVVALFWSFVASTTEASSAKKGYALIISGAQLGSIMGPTLGRFAHVIGTGTLMFAVSCGILIAPLMLKLFMVIIPTEEPTKAQLKKARLKLKTGFFEGLKILLTKPYVMGIFVIATGYEVISTILEYQMNWIATGIYTTPAKFATFTAYQAIGINTLALIVALVGTSFFMRKFGLKFCLMSFPVIIGFIVTGVLLTKNFDISSYQLMWTFLGSLIAIKGLNYAFNKPSMEVLYIPTSKDIKFKSKGWVDTFGGRSTKGIGAAISNTFKHSQPQLFLYGGIISLGIVGAWIAVAAITGSKFQKLQDDNSIIE